MPEFLFDVSTALAVKNSGTYDDFEDVVKQALDKHAPIKTAVHRGNNKPHIHKEMWKAIMKGTRLKNIANRTKTKGDLQKYKAQRNLVVQMNIKTKRQFYASLDLTAVGKDKNFWKRLNPSSQSNQAPKKRYFSLSILLSYLIKKLAIASVHALVMLLIPYVFMSLGSLMDIYH